MKAQIKRASLIVAGWTFILLGVVGLFLPFMQGILFIFIGLLILSSEYVWAHKLLKKLRAKFPRMSHMVDHAEEKGRALLERIGHRRPQARAAESED